MFIYIQFSHEFLFSLVIIVHIQFSHYHQTIKYPCSGVGATSTEQRTLCTSVDRAMREARAAGATSEAEAAVG